MPSGPPGFSSLFILHVIVMWQGQRANQIALFHECVVQPVFIFCLFFCKWSQNVWSTRLSFNSENRVDHSFFYQVRSAAFYAHFRVDTVTSESSTRIPSSCFLSSSFQSDPLKVFEEYDAFSCLIFSLIFFEGTSFSYFSL